MPHVEFSWVGTEKPTTVIRKLQRFGVNLDDATGMWPHIAADFCRREERKFAVEGPGWAELSEEYARKKAKRFPGKPILQATGNLKDSFTNPGRAIQSLGPKHLELGTDVHYARYHQDGFHVSKLIDEREVQRHISKKFVKSINPTLFAKVFKRELARQVAIEIKHLREMGLPIPPDLREQVFKRMHLRGQTDILHITLQHREVEKILGQRPVPPRPPLIDVTPAVGRDWRRIAVDWVKDQAREAGL